MKFLDKIKIKPILHYLIIYLMLLIPSSNLYSILIGNGVLVVFILLLIPIIIFKKYRTPYVIIFSIIIFFTTVFTRLLNGGAGIYSLVELLNCLLIANLAYKFDSEMFFKRFCILSIVFSVISLVCFIFVHTSSAYESLPLKEYLSLIHGTKNYEKYWYTKGVFLNTFNEYHIYRNCGLYTEPGKYQIHLNTVLFILLFFDIKMTERNKELSILIIVITILSTLSTTGYIGLLLNFIFYLLFKDSKNIKFKKRIIKLSFFLILFVFADYLIRDNNSLISITVLEKMFSDNKVDVSVNTGYYRMGTIINSLKIAFNNPLGVGYDGYNRIVDVNQGFVAASIIKYMAIYGVPAWILLIYMIFSPIFKNKKMKNSIKLLFILLFLNTTLAQTHLLYPSLIIFPIIFSKRGELIL